MCAYFKGKVGLGDSCIVDTLCSGSPNTSCFNGICNCNARYVADNWVKCIQSMN